MFENFVKTMGEKSVGENFVKSTGEKKEWVTKSMGENFG